MDNSHTVRARWHARAFAYKACFGCRDATDTVPWWKFWKKPKPAELNEAGRAVLQDLAEYCYVTRPSLKVSKVTQASDPIAMAFAEGRRDVYLRISQMLQLDLAQLDVSQLQRTDE